MIYDTLKLTQALRTTFTSEQAETLATAFAASTDDSIATKLDIAEVKTQIAQLKSEVVDLRGELKTDIAGLKADMATAKIEMVRWIVGAIAFNLLGTLGLMITVSELVLKGR